MPEIARTTLGRNALFCGLIGHGAAMLAAMLTAPGTEPFFRIAFPLSWIVLMAGAYAELSDRGGRSPLRTTRLYVLAILAVLPIVGPLIVLGALYRASRKGQNVQTRLAGLLPAILRLRANPLLAVVLILALFLLFAYTSSRNDPYFKRRTQKNLSLENSLITGEERQNVNFRLETNAHAEGNKMR